MDMVQPWVLLSQFLGILGILAGSALAVSTLWIARSLIRLRTVSPQPERESWPRVSVIVAACNEASTIEAAMSSLLNLDYPGLDIVAVNDRSSDETGAILDRFAAGNERLQVMHIDSLPEGWLGKLHALDRGTGVSDAEWLLYTDADVHFAPGCIQRAISIAEQRKLDHVAAMPQVLPRTFWLHVVQGIFGQFFLLASGAGKSETSSMDSRVGVGAFNLVRREVLERTPGFEWLRLEIADDMGLGLMLKRAGARSALVLGLGCLAIEWYPNLRSMVVGLEKNMFAVMNFSWLRVACGCLLTSTIFLSPLLVLIPPVQPWQIALVVLYQGIMIYVGEKMRQWVGIWWLSTLFLHLAWPVLGWVLFRSAWKVSGAGGVTWRGTFYPIDMLREGRRLKL